MKKIILGLVIVLGLSFCAVSGVGAITYEELVTSLGATSEGNLSYGMRSDAVKEFQQKLSQDPEIYPEGLITGYFGKLTQQAVKRLQAKEGLEQTGVVDEATRKLIFLLPIGSLPVPPIPVPPIERDFCNGKCQAMGYSYGICRSCAVYPGEKPCKEGEVNIGATSDCSVAPGLLGSQKACCCGEKQTSICADSDGGINKYVKGTTCQPSILHIGDSFCKIDRCLSAHKSGITNTGAVSDIGIVYSVEHLLIEYYCKDGKMTSKLFRCENGCADGACINGSVSVCDDDFDCPVKMKCENNVCVGVGCVKEGDHLPGAISPDYLEHMATECCPGLESIEYAGNYNENCAMTYLDGGPSGTCAKCGNGICGLGETKCNCPEDCKIPTERCFSDDDCAETQFCDFPGCAIETGTCVEVPEACTMEYNPVCGCDGKTYGSDCTRRSAKVSKKHNGVCIELVCVPEGGKNYFGKPPCCGDLIKIANSRPAGNGMCIAPTDGSALCTKCGDGICKYPENRCNCLEDCKSSANVQPVINMIKQAIEKLNHAINMLQNILVPPVVSSSGGGGGSSSGE